MSIKSRHAAGTDEETERPAILSAATSRLQAREAAEETIIIRTDASEDGEALISKLREQFPKECKAIMLQPGVPIDLIDVYPYFDHKDAMIHGTNVLKWVIKEISDRNTKRMYKITEIAGNWALNNPEMLGGLLSRDILRKNGLEKYGDMLLDDVLVCLGCHEPAEPRLLQNKSKETIYPRVDSLPGSNVPMAETSVRHASEPAPTLKANFALLVEDTVKTKTDSHRAGDNGPLSSVETKAPRTSPTCLLATSSLEGQLEMSKAKRPSNHIAYPAGGRDAFPGSLVLGDHNTSHYPDHPSNRGPVIGYPYRRMSDTSFPHPPETADPIQIQRGIGHRHIVSVNSHPGGPPQRYRWDRNQAGAIQCPRSTPYYSQRQGSGGSLGSASQYHYNKGDRSRDITPPNSLIPNQGFGNGTGGIHHQAFYAMQPHMVPHFPGPPIPLGPPMWIPSTSQQGQIIPPAGHVPVQPVHLAPNIPHGQFEQPPPPLAFPIPHQIISRVPDPLNMPKIRPNHCHDRHLSQPSQFDGNFEQYPVSATNPPGRLSGLNSNGLSGKRAPQKTWTDDARMGGVICDAEVSGSRVSPPSSYPPATFTTNEHENLHSSQSTGHPCRERQSLVAGVILPQDHREYAGFRIAGPNDLGDESGCHSKNAGTSNKGRKSSTEKRITKTDKSRVYSSNCPTVSQHKDRSTQTDLQPFDLKRLYITFSDFDCQLMDNIHKLPGLCRVGENRSGPPPSVMASFSDEISASEAIVELNKTVRPGLDVRARYAFLLGHRYRNTSKRSEHPDYLAEAQENGTELAVHGCEPHKRHPSASQEPKNGNKSPRTPVTKTKETLVNISKSESINASTTNAQIQAQKNFAGGEQQAARGPRPTTKAVLAVAGSTLNSLQIPCATAQISDYSEGSPRRKARTRPASLSDTLGVDNQPSSSVSNDERNLSTLSARNPGLQPSGLEALASTVTESSKANHVQLDTMQELDKSAQASEIESQRVDSEKFQSIDAQNYSKQSLGSAPKSHGGTAQIATKKGSDGRKKGNATHEIPFRSGGNSSASAIQNCSDFVPLQSNHGNFVSGEAFPTLAEAYKPSTVKRSVKVDSVPEINFPSSKRNESNSRTTFSKAPDSVDLSASAHVIENSEVSVNEDSQAQTSSGKTSPSKSMRDSKSSSPTVEPVALRKFQKDKSAKAMANQAIGCAMWTSESQHLPSITTSQDSLTPSEERVRARGSDDKSPKGSEDNREIDPKNQTSKYGATGGLSPTNTVDSVMIVVASEVPKSKQPSKASKILRPKPAVAASSKESSQPVCDGEVQATQPPEKSSEAPISGKHEDGSETKESISEHNVQATELPKTVREVEHCQAQDNDGKVHEVTKSLDLQISKESSVAPIATHKKKKNKKSGSLRTNVNKAPKTPEKGGPAANLSRPSSTYSFSASPEHSPECAQLADEAKISQNHDSSDQETLQTASGAKKSSTTEYNLSPSSLPGFEPLVLGLNSNVSSPSVVDRHLQTLTYGKVNLNQMTVAFTLEKVDGASQGQKQSYANASNDSDRTLGHRIFGIPASQHQATIATGTNFRMLCSAQDAKSGGIMDEALDLSPAAKVRFWDLRNHNEGSTGMKTPSARRPTKAKRQKRKVSMPKLQSTSVGVDKSGCVDEAGIYPNIIVNQGEDIDESFDSAMTQQFFPEIHSSTKSSVYNTPPSDLKTKTGFHSDGQENPVGVHDQTPIQKMIQAKAANVLLSIRDTTSNNSGSRIPSSDSGTPNGVCHADSSREGKSASRSDHTDYASALLSIARSPVSPDFGSQKIHEASNTAKMDQGLGIDFRPSGDGTEGSTGSSTTLCGVASSDDADGEPSPQRITSLPTDSPVPENEPLEFSPPARRSSNAAPRTPVKETITGSFADNPSEERTKQSPECSSSDDQTEGRRQVLTPSRSPSLKRSDEEDKSECKAISNNVQEQPCAEAGSLAEDFPPLPPMSKPAPLESIEEVESTRKKTSPMKSKEGISTGSPTGEVFIEAFPTLQKQCSNNTISNCSTVGRAHSFSAASSCSPSRAYADVAASSANEGRGSRRNSTKNINIASKSNGYNGQRRSSARRGSGTAEAWALPEGGKVWSASSSRANSVAGNGTTTTTTTIATNTTAAATSISSSTRSASSSSSGAGRNRSKSDKKELKKA